MRLQGVGLEEFRKYKMEALTPSLLADFCGNAFLVSQCCWIFSRSRDLFSDTVTDVLETGSHKRDATGSVRRSVPRWCCRPSAPGVAA